VSIDIIGILHLFQGCIRYSFAIPPFPEQVDGRDHRLHQVFSLSNWAQHEVYATLSGDSHLTARSSCLSLVSCVAHFSLQMRTSDLSVRKRQDDSAFGWDDDMA